MCNYPNPSLSPPPPPQEQEQEQQDQQILHRALEDLRADNRLQILEKQLCIPILQAEKSILERESKTENFESVAEKVMEIDKELALLEGFLEKLVERGILLENAEVGELERNEFWEGIGYGSL